MVNKQTAEAFVLIREEPSPLRYRPLRGQALDLRSHSDPSHPDNARYEEGKDYVVDYDEGWIRRERGSRIPDGSHHPIYGMRPFDQATYPDYSNRAYTVYADYAIEAGQVEAAVTAADVERSGLLERTIRKLANGEEATYVVYGDSISAGGEASEPRLAYYNRFADQLGRLFPRGRLSVVNKSIGGEASVGGAKRVDADVVPLRPDLVSIGYGMNDQYKLDDGNSVSLEDFEKNLRHMIDTIREACDSDIVLVTPCEPNPNWLYASGDIPHYADTVRRLGRAYGIGVADAHALWREELAAGKTPESLLLNNINHPNDYGHWIYSRAFSIMLNTASGFPREPVECPPIVADN
ncbi:GDSL-type esterase/lipase family protein [Cohnella sp. OV330]|uniref:SGNH/GDSL hydrolase family protein n=1 Tax=Cohnella sp. OV330 TaxID=1855288 RepID=UPI00131460FD|nr:GDSL-type esterase/lipase family protein [Cohnella sp. OV330]